MRSTQQFSITLPTEMAEIVEQKVRSGDYASVSEVIRDGMRALMERDAAVERWLREDVVAGHAAYLADPSQAVPSSDILDRIKRRRASALDQ
ncbi:type II toxin-antitoxin system ParD family antitoxin [Acidisoma silvae]|uniref:Type II toxin-antitoxin system ParD family antitoxin n=1 Tax=Acidisoma silvae TaxID=2802396 RepID=A0A963YQZ7_9PROT|nr:type II toxin-antitoxin system ParD family antitoxin [Acidisoma silvae]MCB8875226.1 type II toxin-antitoxin system ParD family antitoxin [Acidisoma silvae]